MKADGFCFYCRKPVPEVPDYVGELVDTPWGPLPKAKNHFICSNLCFRLRKRRIERLDNPTRLNKLLNDIEKAIFGCID